jgi:aspartyl protease family protein
MLRKLFIFGICAGSSASVPILYQSNPDAFDRLLRSTLEEKTTLPQTTAVSLTVARPQPAAEILVGRKVKLPADPRGHFTADFKFNGRKINAMIDTGATLVAINLSTARRIGIMIGPNDFQHKVSTANGEVRGATATIERLQIGRILVENVEALVLEDRALADTLIGMTFLNRLARYQVENGALLLVQ